jgi:hypothetical protein
VSKSAHLRVYRFDPGAVFEGGLLAALERMQLGEDWRLLDVLFVTRDATSGELEAVDLGTGGADATLASLLDFRLDPGRRRALTERTLGEHPGGVPRPLIEAIGATLEPGAAIFAVLHAGTSGAVLEDAVARSGGRRIADEPADHASSLAGVGQRLRAAMSSASPKV